MGGCRCTYRNCTVKYDGKTHMFHYPVFDKIRCHQWLQNAHRLDFLNLKVSQLKNRVICQHHFRPDNFMNYKKDKLTFDAIPTEDGPYCDPTKSDYNGINQVLKYPITVEDIENECYMNSDDKKANMSMKYADFLTNSELVDLSMLTLDKTLTIPEDKYNIEIVDDTNLDKMFQTNNILFSQKMQSLLESSKKCQPVLRVEPYLECGNTVVKSDNIIHNKSQIVEHVRYPVASSVNAFQTKDEKPDMKNSQLIQPNNTIKTEKVRIISQKKICEPLKITGNFEPISPSLVLYPKKKRVQHDNIEMVSEYNNKCELTLVPVEFSSNQVTNLNQLEPMPFMNNNISENLEENKYERIPLLNDSYERKIDITPEKYKSEKISQSVTDHLDRNKVNATDSDYKFGKVALLNSNFNEKNLPKIRTGIEKTQIEAIKTCSNSCKELSPSLLHLKNKIPPERVAEIQEKRKFNMKLRDIIEAELNQLEENEKEITNQNKNINTIAKKENTKKKVSQLLSRTSDLSNSSKYALASMEARLQSMENNLLNKIEQNSKIIKELKNVITCTNRSTSVSTQTKITEEIQKKNLYKEISQYLSPQANSLIYEELFLNKYTQKELTYPQRSKRRRYR